MNKPKVRRRPTVGDHNKRLRAELLEILAWAKIEKAPLRQGEIDSIERVLRETR